MTDLFSWFAACALLIVLTAALPGAADTAANDLGAIQDAGAKVEKLAGDMKFTEGPVWDPKGFLLFSDIPADTIFKWTPEKGREVFRGSAGNPNGHTLDNEGRLISCEHGNRRVSRTEKDGKVVALAERYDGKRLNSPNDLVVKRSDGSIYFTDPPYGIRKEQEELGFYGVYRLAKDGTLTLLVRDFVKPNGLAFTPDEKQLYVNDTEKGHIRVFAVKADGTLENGRVFADLPRKEGEDGAPDGMKVDVQGNVYCTGPGGVWVFSPAGKLLGRIVAPEVPANIGWGDTDYKTLYLTARTGLYRVRLKIPGVRPGMGGKP